MNSWLVIFEIAKYNCCLPKLAVKIFSGLCVAVEVHRSKLTIKSLQIKEIGDSPVCPFREVTPTTPSLRQGTKCAMSNKDFCKLALDIWNWNMHMYITWLVTVYEQNWKFCSCNICTCGRYCEVLLIGNCSTYEEPRIDEVWMCEATMADNTTLCQMCQLWKW